MNIHDLQDAVRLEVTFTDFNGNPADPSSVTVRIRKPNGTTLTQTFPGAVIKDGIGQYHLDVIVDLPGYWVYRWEGSGALQESAQDVFLVRESAFD